MIKGLGTDLVEVARIEKALLKENGFREMVFSSAEIAYSESKANKYECYAARFAAKEAFFKALGTGWLDNTAFNEVEVLNDAAGKPSINLLGKTKATLAAIGNFNILVSLSHVKSMASATVILEETHA